MFHAAGGHAELLSPLNGLRKQNRALTVPLPEEVSIPAGCSVELVEVKTVNGTKELKLRLISQQENKSVIKDSRTTVFQNVAPEEQLLPALNRANVLKSTSIGRSSAGRKSAETAAASVEHPGVFSAPLNQRANNKIGLKRSNPKVINLDFKTATPHKVPRILNLVREGNGGIKVMQKEMINHKVAACPPSISTTRAVNRVASTLSPQHATPCVSQRQVDERKNPTPEMSKAMPTTAGGSNSMARDVSLAVKQEPTENDGKDSLAPARVPLPAASKPPPILHGDPIPNRSFSVPKLPKESTSFKTPALVNDAGSKMSTWNKAVRSEGQAAESRAGEPENFPRDFLGLFFKSTIGRREGDHPAAGDGSARDRNGENLQRRSFFSSNDWHRAGKGQVDARKP
ncbi:unnamed protein product [Tetraodon nigroviridis]|uniref:(spotted green pufferfish) hypothetical protein n=1 Tax=Tetraodon nigroviridis TaxID=99883 RepID=Q4RTH0_TETNG|nr:unnamed protein product [Tetraodon nigroviridis]